MSGSPASRAARPGDNDPILVSPLNPLVPTGYRNIQPFQKGKGWHSNGRTARYRVASTQASDGTEEKERGVVFPLLPGHEHVRPGAQGPDVSAVEAAACGADQPDDRLEKDEAANGPALTSPRAPAPPTNGAPQRSSRTEIRSNSSTGASFRGRALSGSGSRPTSPATVASDESLKARSEADAAVPVGPDPALMQQLWQEYAARSHAANRQVDTAVYHEKMHRRYGEQRALKERVAHLEQALETMERERDEAQTQAQSATKQLALDRSTSELSDSAVASPSMKTARSSVVKASQAGEPVNAEEKSYRERSFALERALSQAKVSLLEVQGELRQQTSRAAERMQALEAQLVLERNTSLELARQLRDISAGFTRASAELVETRVTLEREQQRSQEVIEQARVQNAQLLSDTRRAQLETRMKLAVRSLGREALRQKMETLVSRTMRAEQNMRVAQLETKRVCWERDATREQLEQVLSSHAIKYHSLGAAGGVPGILKRSTPLTNGARMVSDQLLLLQVLYEETEEPEDPDGGFSVHFVAYEPRSAQDDFLTFHLRDVQRLVPNHESFLARHSVRRRERLQALADLLLSHVHAGYKNGHLVLAETSGAEAATRLPREQLAAQQEQHRTQQVAVYRGTRYLSVISGDDNDSVLADLSVTEAFAAATSQVWWLEVRAVMLGSEGGWDSESLTTKVDLRQLVTFCSTFASYRPSQSQEGSSNDDPELFAVHEALLVPLFDSLRVVVPEAGGTARLEIMGAEDDSRPSTSVESQTRRRRLPIEDQMHLEEELEEKETAMAIRTPPVASTLTHQSVVNVGDVFYCVRLQELWDGELLLDLTMDDPETQHHFHRVLHEPQLAKLVERLILDGALDDDDDEERKTAALQVKFGLASVLHRPLCKLVCSHVQPVLPLTSQTSTKTAPEDGQISLRGLFNDADSGESLRSEVGAQAYEMRAMVLDAPACASLGWTYDREVRVITASRSVLPDEKAVHRMLQDILTAEDTQVRRQRSGVRFQGAAGFSLVQTIAANVSSFGDVALFDVLSLTTDHDGPSYLPLVLVVEDPARDDSPLQLVFEALGIEEDSSEFTREALARSRTGSRAHEPFGQEAPP